jgi:hypothetical protein
VGLGLDESEVQGAIRIHSTSIGDERANVYLYPLLDETKMKKTLDKKIITVFVHFVIVRGLLTNR